MPATRNSYTFKEGLTMMAAKAIGVDPDLAVNAGENARAAINALRNAAKARNAKDKAALIRDAQKELQSISASQHPKLVNALQARLLALQGRGGDTEIAHLTPGEVVLPRSLQTPAIMQQISAEARRQGVSAARLAVGNRANSINPKTGQREFAIEEVVVTDRPDWFETNGPGDGYDKYGSGAGGGNADGGPGWGGDEVFRYGSGTLGNSPSIVSVPTADELKAMSDELIKSRTELLKSIEMGAKIAAIPGTALSYVLSPATGIVVGVISSLVLSHLDNITDAYQSEYARRNL